MALYVQYASKVGPMKKFRGKRVMYEHISKEILQILGIFRTATVPASFKTIAKRKKTEDTNNKTSSHTHYPVSYEEEFAPNKGCRR